MRTPSEHSSGMPELPFDAGQYVAVYNLAQEMATRLGNPAAHGAEGWQALDTLRAHPNAVGILRASLNTIHAPTTTQLLANQLQTQGSEIVPAFARQVLLGDGGEALLRAIGLWHTPHPSAMGDQLTDLLGAAYCSSSPTPNQLAPQLAGLLPGCLLRKCQALDRQKQQLPLHYENIYASRLAVVCNDLPNDTARMAFARQLVTQLPLQQRGGSMDSIMRLLLLSTTAPLARHLFAALGLPRSARSFWEEGFGQARLPNNEPDPRCITSTEYLEACAQQTLNIERERPGGVRLLARRHVLRNLGRMPEDWLLDLIDNGHKRAARTILVGIATGCHNGAQANNIARINEARRQLPPDTTMQPIEIASTQELEERLAFLERARAISGRAGTIVGVILTGHESDENGTGVMLRQPGGARNPGDTTLGSPQLRGRIGAQLLRLLESGAPQLVLTCTGARNRAAFASQLYQRTGHPTVGMSEPALLSHLDIAFRSDGTLQFNPTFATLRPEPDNTWSAHPLEPTRFSKE